MSIDSIALLSSPIFFFFQREKKKDSKENYKYGGTLVLFSFMFSNLPDQEKEEGLNLQHQDFTFSTL